MKMILASLVGLVIGIYFLIYMIPPIFLDLTVDESDFVQSSDHRIVNASCRVKVFVISDCKVYVQHRSSGEDLSFRYLIFGQLDGDTVYAMINRKDDYLSSNIGVEYALNRLIVALVIGGIVLFLSLNCFCTVVFGRRKVGRTNYGYR